ncbi:sentrin-specific protease 2-like [Meriones unguiculatus]|uniref:sentrin-specific protease 2-like n=1 Tax=Meriones unguiculatus TaxID=10047 RepID=UPI00293E71A0|nr:sentrin-specific protease 2-like [Meriones unguiculatus]
MSCTDKTSTNDPGNIKRISNQEHPLKVQQTCTLTGNPESSRRDDGEHMRKSRPTIPFMLYHGQQCEIMNPEYPSMGQKRKWQAEGGNNFPSAEGLEPQKKLKEDNFEIELGCKQLVQGQVHNAQELGRVQKKNKEYTQNHRDEATAEVRLSDGGKRRKRPYCNIEQHVEKQHREKYQRLLEELQTIETVSSDPHSTHLSPVDTLKGIKSCMEGQSLRSKTNHSEPNQPDSVVPEEDQLPIRDGKRHSEVEICHSEKRDQGNIQEGERRQHPQPDFLGGAQTQLPTDRVSKNTLIQNKVPKTPEAKKKGNNEQEEGGELDRGSDITAEMEKEIQNALGPGPQDEVLSCAFKLHITRADMHTLKDMQWLNDEVINFYMNLLMQRTQTQGYPSLHAFNTFFYTKLKSGGYKSVKRWTQAINLFEKELILVPIHLDVHWSLVVVNLRQKSVVYLDSMGQERPDILKLIFHYLQDESKARRNIDLNPLDWKQYSMTAEEIPQQLNGSDCGMFMCKYADCISRGRPITFSQRHVPLFRKKMVWEILHSCLL